MIYFEPGKHKHGTIHHERCRKLSSELSKQILRCVREGNIYGMLCRVDRLNRLTIAAYSGITWLTPEEVLNNALEHLVFEDRS